MKRFDLEARWRRTNIAFALDLCCCSDSAIFFARDHRAGDIRSVYSRHSVAASECASEANCKTAGRRRHDLCNHRHPCHPGISGGWGFGLVVQWLVNNTGRLQTLYSQATEWLEGHGVSIATLVADNYSPGWIIGAVREIGGRGYGLVSFFVIAFAFIVLGLLEVDIARKNIERLNNASLRRSLLVGVEEIAEKFQKYMVVRTTMSLLTGVVVWSFALVAGIELATAWGVIAFVLNYIPFLGPLIATVFPTLFVLVQSGSWEACFIVFAGLNLIQFFIGSYLEPRIAGAALSMSPFIVLLAVFFWSFLWGIAGAFLGLPIMIAILTICEQHKSTEWFALLLSGRERKSG